MLEAKISGPPCRSEPLALVIPYSLSAEEALATNHNRRHLCSYDEIEKDSNELVGSRRRRHLVAKLSFATFSLRRYLCFGSSRSTEFQLAQADDVAPFHFAIHFNMQDASLLLTDTSDSGIWIADAESYDGSNLEFLNRSTRPLLRDTRILVGRDRRFDLCIRVETYAKHTSRFALLFQDYARSMPNALRNLRNTSKRRRSSCQSASNKRANHGASQIVCELM